MTRPILPAAILLLAAACSQEDPNNIAIDSGNEVGVETIAGDESNGAATLPPADPADPAAPAAPGAPVAEQPPGNGAAPQPAPPTTVPVPAIPAQYRGRWGMVPADCTSTRGDAKGLITVSDRTIRFYESNATLIEQRPAIATSFSGKFDFTGEGQRWTKVMTFTRTGDTLKRADSDGSFTYRRCA